jgi:hypothetical protein
MLESEIHGKIEHPSVYFDTLNRNRYKDMDLLLLTQGWRDFIWKRLLDSTVTFLHPYEKGITISGNLYSILGHKPKRNVTISLGLMQDSKSIFKYSQTDSLGRYSFENLDITGKWTVILSAHNKKFASNGEIIMNPVLSQPTPIRPPAQEYSYIEKKVTIKDTAYGNEMSHYLALHNDKGLPTLQIKELEITGKSEPKNEINKDMIALYGPPEYSLNITDNDGGYSDLFQYLNGRFPGFMAVPSNNGNYSFLYRGGHNVKVVIDGMVVPNQPASQMQLLVTGMQMSDIDKVDLIDGLGNGCDCVICIYTKRGQGSFSSITSISDINTTIDGFYQARVFSAPAYEIPRGENSPADFRTTMYWNPNILTDKDGNATISFYNDDKTDPVNIFVEGMAYRGIPLKATTNYLVR